MEAQKFFPTYVTMTSPTFLIWQLNCQLQNNLIFINRIAVIEFQFAERTRPSKLYLTKGKETKLNH